MKKIQRNIYYIFRFMTNTYLNEIDYFWTKKLFEKNNFFVINNFFFQKYVLKSLDNNYIITKNHDIENKKRNKTIFFQWIIPSFIYSYFCSTSFYSIMTSFFWLDLISDKKVDIYSVESLLWLKSTWRWIIMDMYSQKDFYNFSFNTDNKSIWLYIYIVNSKNEINLSLNWSDLILKQNDLLVLWNKQFNISIVNKFDTDVFLLVWNLISNDFKTDIVYKCNIS